VDEPVRDDRHDATASTRRAHEAAAADPALGDDGDFVRARAGLLAGPPARQFAGRWGQSVWDLDRYAFLEGPSADAAPATVHPSLWRQARLNQIAGLFQVSARIFQVRGLDLANVTFVAGDTGWVVIDALYSAEMAAAALAMANEHLGERPVRALVYTHSHIDHFAGVHGLIDEAAVRAGEVELIGPVGFLEAAVSENVLAGTAMRRRGTYMYGALLATDERGHVDNGLGKAIPTLPSIGLLGPTTLIERTGTELVVDGVRLVFQLTPDTEAPSEMNIHLPDDRALCMAENCTATLHNLYTLRGAPVRDALAWSKYIDESIELYGATSDVAFASHHWPRFGREEVSAYLASQRDAYRFLHDQTLRLANHGLTMNEIAEELALPPALRDEFFNRDYYGTVSHNVKAVYQRYLGWFDGNPAHLHPHPPVEAARRYVEYMGGADAVLARARVSYAEGDYRWVAEVVNHVVFADPANEAARRLGADALEQLGYQSESGPWRNFYLTGALELRANGTILAGLGRNAISTEFVRAMSVEMLIDLMGVRLDGPASAELTAAIDLVVSDRGDERWALTVRHGALSAVRGRGHGAPHAVLHCTHAALGTLASGHASLADVEATGEVLVEGDRERVARWLSHLDLFSIGFEIVLP
jgi:alkyl sulfatase BDS1-like metallo-beta-lactamase superfamily hydrolase